MDEQLQAILKQERLSFYKNLPENIYSLLYNYRHVKNKVPQKLKLRDDELITLLRAIYLKNPTREQTGPLAFSWRKAESKILINEINYLQKKIEQYQDDIPINLKKQIDELIKRTLKDKKIYKENYKIQRQPIKINLEKYNKIYYNSITFDNQNVLNKSIDEHLQINTKPLKEIQSFIEFPIDESQFILEFPRICNAIYDGTLPLNEIHLLTLFTEQTLKSFHATEVDSLKTNLPRLCTIINLMIKNIQGIKAIESNYKNRKEYQKATPPFHFDYWLSNLENLIKEVPDYQHTLENTGALEGAKSIYTELSSTRHYYGFLSSIKINKKPTLNNVKIDISTKALKNVEKFPAVHRIEELISINRQRNARAEWHHFLKNLSEEQKLHVAYFAFKKGWYDLSILALSRTEKNNDLSLRFPIAYQKPILRFAKKFDLDPAWVFALTRQESAFFSYATSPVGAIGLMQLMPATAIHVAAKNKISLPSKHHLYSPEKNIELGTTYLKYLKDQWHQHPIVTTASYNAGPGRAKRWLPKEPVDADIWVENIPFEETRNYVKNVISSTSIYQSLLGNSVQLTHYMRPISNHK